METSKMIKTATIMDGVSTTSMYKVMEEQVEVAKRDIEENKKTLSKHHVELEEIKATVKDSVLLFQAKVGMLSSKHTSALGVVKKYCRIIVALELIDIVAEIINYCM